MHKEITESNQPSETIIQTEQVEQIIKAVLAGKYSWACVLFLHFIGYNPLKYIPYRTYIRLLKNNCLIGRNYNLKPDETTMEILGIKSSWMHLDNSTNGTN
jgi:hypothetical protein